MNDSHKQTKKLNRYKRLVRRCADCPADNQKQLRKAALESELRGIKLIN